MKKCKCGCMFFRCEQEVCISQNVLVDGNDEFVSDIDHSYDTIDVEPPRGPYICIKCGEEYEDITELDNADMPKEEYDKQKRTLADMYVAQQEVKNLSPEALLLAYIRYRRCLKAREIGAYFKKLQETDEDFKDMAIPDEDFEDLAEEYEQEYDGALSDEEQYERIIKRRLNLPYY